MAEETLEIKYLIEAQDKATKVLERVDKSVQGLTSSMEEADKAQIAMAKHQTSLGERFRKTHTIMAQTVDTIKNFWDLLTNFDFKKLERALIVLGFLARLKGLNGVSKSLFGMAAKVDVLAFSFNKLETAIKNTQEKYGSFTNLLLEKTGVNALIGGLADAAKAASITGVALLGLSTATGTVNFLVKALVPLEDVFLKIDARIYTTFAQRFPRAAALALDATDLMFRGLSKVIRELKKTNVFLTTTRDTTKAVGKTFGEALGKTEALERGFFGLASRSAIASAGMTALGTALLTSDGVMAKTAGITLLALAAAFGSLALVMRQVLITVGRFVFNVGTKIVRAIESSIQKMNKLNDASFTLAFVLNNLDKETQGASGSMDDWLPIMESFTKETGFATTEVQKSTSELVRLGSSIGLTKSQMEDLLPVIGDLAEVNHRDLFDSTLAVVEALNGQSVMLQGMGVNLTQHAVDSSKAGEAVGGHIKKLTEAEKVQVRYSALLEKTTSIQGIAKASTNTLTGSMRRQATAVENMSKHIGAGAVIIETQFNTHMAALVNFVSELSEPFLKAIGFIGAFTGRLLQGVGIALEWSFAIVFLTSTIAALNIVLKSTAISTFLAQMAQAPFLVKSLAKFFPVLSAAIITLLTQLAAAGVGVTSISALIIASSKAIAKALWTIIAPIVIIAIKVAVVVGVFIVLYKALELIDKKTGIFSKMAKGIREWWNASGALNSIGEILEHIANGAMIVLGRTTVWLAQKFVFLYSIILAVEGVYLLLRRGVIDLYHSFVALAERALVSVKNGFIAASNAVVDFVLGETALAKSLTVTEKQILKTKEVTKGLTEEEKTRIKEIDEQIKANDRLIASLEKVDSAKIFKGGGAGDTADKHEKELALIDLFNESKQLREDEFKAMSKLNKELTQVEDYQLLVKGLGAEEAQRLAFETRKLLIQANAAKTIEEKNKLHKQAMLMINQGYAKADNKISQDAQKTEQRTLQAKYTAAQNFTQAGLLLAKQGSREYKALAIAGATINTYRAANQVLADPFIAGPWKPVAVASTIALGLAQVAQIVNAGSFFTGGIVGGSPVGDKQTIAVNGGEGVFTSSQQHELFSIAKGNGGGNNGEMAEAINNLAEAIQRQDNVVEINGREIARAVREEVTGGFQLA